MHSPRPSEPWVGTAPILRGMQSHPTQPPVLPFLSSSKACHPPPRRSRSSQWARASWVAQGTASLQSLGTAGEERHKGRCQCVPGVCGQQRSASHFISQLLCCQPNSPGEQRGSEKASKGGSQLPACREIRFAFLLLLCPVKALIWLGSTNAAELLQLRRGSLPPPRRCEVRWCHQHHGFVLSLAASRAAEL